MPLTLTTLTDIAYVLLGAVMGALIFSFVIGRHRTRQVARLADRLDAWIDVHFDDAGQLIATDTTGTDQIVGRLGLSQFANNAGLQANGQNLWSPTAASGPAAPLAQGAATAPIVVAGALEGSNVDMADEFTRLIQAQRGYQLNAKVVQAWDDIQRMANELRSA